MAYGNQMHMVTESAEHAATQGVSTSDSLRGHVTRLSGEVSGVVGSSWAMDQSVAFGHAHDKWAAAMGRLSMALDKVATDTRANAGDYHQNDAVHTSALNSVDAPMFSGVL